jgi:hypothetical protein
MRALLDVLDRYISCNRVQVPNVPRFAQDFPRVIDVPNRRHERTDCFVALFSGYLDLDDIKHALDCWQDWLEYSTTKKVLDLLHDPNPAMIFFRWV